MSENWKFFPCSMGDNQAFIFLNVGLVDSMDSAPSILVKLQLRYQSPDPEGLPTNEEFEAVRSVEDRIESFSKSNADQYVGRVTVGGYRIFYIYTSSNEACWLHFIDELTTESGYDIQLSHGEDPEHSGYFNELYPTPDDWQIIKDLGVIEDLANHGDDSSKSRKILHWIYFDNKAASIEFVKWAESDRFEEEAELSAVTEEGKYCVRLSHQGTMNLGDISSHTITLRRQAAEFNGEYDGWETPLVKAADD